MKSLFILMTVFAFSWNNIVVDNSYLDDLKTDLEKLANATEKFDFENFAFEEDVIHIDQGIARVWASEQFGTLEAFTDIFVRIKTNLDYLAKDKDKPNITVEDYMNLILFLKDIESNEPSDDAAPFKCYNAYVKDFSMCTAYGVVGEYGGPGSDCLIYLLYVADAKRKFYSCIEQNYGK